MDVEGFKSAGVFYNAIEFPRGFGRSGEFTIAESALLEKYGQAMKALADHSINPLNVDEKNFVDVIDGKRAARTVLEQVWLKYMNKVGASKVAVSAFGSITKTAMATGVDPKLMSDDLEDREDLGL